MRGLRLQLASLFLLAVLPGLIAAASFNYLHYRDARAAEAARLLARAKLVGGNKGVLLDGVAGLLGDLANRTEIRNAAVDPPACEATLAGARAIHPELTHIGVFTAHGALLCANGSVGIDANEGARPWFLHVLHEGDFAIGEYRGSGRGGTIETGYPVLRGDGTLVGVIGAGIDIGWFAERFAQLALEHGVVLTLFDDGGTALARYPDPDGLTGHSLAFVARRIATNSAGFDEKEFLDGTKRIAAFAPLGGKDWHDLTISLDMDPALLLASERWNLALDLASLLSVVLTGAAAAFHFGGKLLIRPVAEIGAVADRLTAGDMSARVGGPYRDDELGRVARAFDGMAEALCLRDQELRRANAYKSRVLAIAGHDLRQPLQIISMSHEMVGRTLTNPRHQALIARADQAVERLNHQLDLITSAGRIDEAAPKPALAAVPLGPLLAATAAEHAPLAEAKGLRITVVATSIAANTDAEMLATILRNLVGNAVKYTERGRIVIGCRRRGPTLAIEVCDTGIGVPEDQIGHIFEAFYQLDPNAAGSGLGLAIVKRTADVLGHSLEVRSLPGHGSRFRVILPRAAERPLRAQLRSA